MSQTLVLDAIADAAIKISDDTYGSVAIPRWTSFVNSRLRKMCTRLRLIKRRATFKIEANNELYSLPDKCVQATYLEYTPTPSTPSTFREMKEKTQDEFRVATTWSYPTGDPFAYFMEQGYFYLINMPTVDVDNGGRITYWSLPENPITAPDREYLSTAEITREILVQGIMADAYESLNKREERDDSERMYEHLIAVSGLMLEDRSDDRRESLRPASRVRGFKGQT